MATKLKPSSPDLYDRDFYAWAKGQAALLRARRFEDLDLENLIEEVDDLAGALYRAARSRVRIIIEHLLKLQHSPAAAPRAGWVETVLTQRSDLEDEITPSLRPRADADLARLYAKARRNAATALREHGEHAAADALPETCPYTLDQITGDWWP